MDEKIRDEKKGMIEKSEFAEFEEQINCRFGDKDIENVIAACRRLDSWFIKKRTLIASKYPDLAITHTNAILDEEIERKEKLLLESKQNMASYKEKLMSAIDAANRN